MRSLKLAVYTVARFVGAFALSRFLMRRRFLVLAYHGFQVSDEAAFRPILFMDREVFARRLDAIRRGGHPVLPLAEAVERCRDGTLPPNTVAITIDDGFHSVLDVAAPMLKQHGFPATLYVTSYYVDKGAPIFRLAVQYLFWKSARERLEPVDAPWSADETVDLDDAAAADEAMWRIIDHGEKHCDEPGRQAICDELGELLGVDFAAIRDSRALSLATPAELRDFADFDIDIQLHTHRHTFTPDDADAARRELRDNRHFLETALGRRLEHFCYPSGVWAREILPMLREEGMRTATTCQPGLNDHRTDPLALYRFVDQDDLHDIEFEAELSGFAELLRILTLRRRRTNAVHRVRSLDTVPATRS